MVGLEMEKADSTFAEHEGLTEKGYWNTLANRLYYALFHAVSAMLISDEATEKVFELGRNTTYMELSTEPRYMDEFVAACFIPHTDATLFD